jgi:hypothetical protein
MFLRYPKLTLFITNFFILVILSGIVEISSWLYLRSLWGINIEQQISPEYLNFDSKIIKRLYDTEEIEPIKKLLKGGGNPFQEDYISPKFSNNKYRIRRVKNQVPWPPDKNRINIFFFGGSTTLGFGVLHDQSIPSYAQELFYEQGNSNLSIYNFGQTSYTSLHELGMFKYIIENGFIPQVAVFIDGLNDYYHAILNDYKPNSFLKTFENIFKKTNLSKVFNIIFGVKSSDESIEKAVDKLNNHRRIIKKELCEKLRIFCVFVQQPVPLYHFDIKKHLFFNYKYKGKYKLAVGFGNNTAYGYEVFNRKLANNEIPYLKHHLLNLSKFEIDSNLYIDSFHYSPKFNQAIAKKIVIFIKKKTSL